jgi:hypothetical protein
MAGKKSAGVEYAGPACPRCGRELDLATIESGTRHCDGCGGEFLATRFTPPAVDASVERLAHSGPGGASACGQHPKNAAVASCARCGVFMCSLCRIEADRMILCPACFERLSDEGALASSRVAFRDYSRMAGTIAILGLLMCYIGVVSGPITIYCGIRGLRQKAQMDENEGQVMLWVAMLLGLAQFLIGSFLIAQIFGARI